MAATPDWQHGVSRPHSVVCGAAAPIPRCCRRSLSATPGSCGNRSDAATPARPMALFAAPPSFPMQPCAHTSGAKRFQPLGQQRADHAGQYIAGARRGQRWRRNRQHRQPAVRSGDDGVGAFGQDHAASRLGHSRSHSPPLRHNFGQRAAREPRQFRRMGRQHSNCRQPRRPVRELGQTVQPIGIDERGRQRLRQQSLDKLAGRGRIAEPTTQHQTRRRQAVWLRASPRPPGRRRQRVPPPPLAAAARSARQPWLLQSARWCGARPQSPARRRCALPRHSSTKQRQETARCLPPATTCRKRPCGCSAGGPAANWPPALRPTQRCGTRRSAQAARRCPPPPARPHSRRRERDSGRIWHGQR